MSTKRECRGGSALLGGLCMAGSLIAAFPAWGFEQNIPTTAVEKRSVAVTETASVHPQYDDILAARISQSEQQSGAQSSFTVHSGQGDDLASAALHASSSVGALGWRLHSELGWITPWAELSYQRAFADDSSQPGSLSARENPHWIDLTVGAHLPISQDLSAFASFSQTGGSTANSNEQFLYNVGLNARF